MQMVDSQHFVSRIGQRTYCVDIYVILLYYSRDRCDDYYFFSFNASSDDRKKENKKISYEKKIGFDGSAGGCKVARCDGPGRVSTCLPAAPGKLEWTIIILNNISYYYCVVSE